MQNGISPLVSVAIITYNQKEFLKEAIESVLMQNYEPLEIIVGDDGSTDGTHELLLNYKKLHPNKFILHLGNKNIGVTNNANLVHEKCTGKYIAWLGGDDIMLPTKINKQVEFLENEPLYNIVYHNLDVFESLTDKHLYFYNKPGEKFSGNQTMLIKHGTFNGACSSMFRRSAAAKPAFNPSLPVASDWLYSINHLSNGRKIGFIDEVLGRYRRHHNNVSNIFSPFAKQGMIDTLNTAKILLVKYPEQKKNIHYWYSTYYRGKRNINYEANLKKSISYNIFNFKSAALLFIYKISFKKIKL